jgi:hypothetical protein
MGVAFKNGGKRSYRALKRIGRIAEWLHAAIPIYIHGMGCLKALDANEKRFALSGDVLFENRGCHNF